MIWVVAGGLLVVLAVAAALVRKGSSSTASINQGTRAVIVPTADAARTVLVPPCGTGTSVASSSAAALRQMTGTTTIELPRGPGVRLVLVPRCGGGRGGSAGTSNLPSALFVPRAGVPLPKVTPGGGGSGSTQIANPGSAQSQLSLPSPSPVRTIIVAPCEKPQASGPAEQVLSASGGARIAVAPAC